MTSQRHELLTVTQVLAALGDVSPRIFYPWRGTANGSNGAQSDCCRCLIRQADIRSVPSRGRRQ
jgi:hypothetical protein